MVHYFNSKSAKEAAVKAGSQAKRPENIASNIMALPQVEAAIAWGMKNRVEAAGIDSREVVSMLKKVYSEAMDKGKYADANKSAELMGQHLGMFKTGTGQMPSASSGAHKTSEEIKDLQKDIQRFIATLQKPKL